jgi:hypothetical protein
VKRIVGAVVVAILLAPGCDMAPNGPPNGPTPGGDPSPRCLALIEEYDHSKAAAESHPSDEAEATLDRAREKLFASGCLKS